MKKYRAGVLGATGMVGQQFVTLLEGHPWFEVVALAASPRSRGKTYKAATEGRWAMQAALPPRLKSFTVHAVQEDMERVVQEVDVVFCALDLDKEAIRSIEEAYAGHGVAVISNNSAHRWTMDVPMIMPEVNPDHAALIDTQRQRRGWDTGLIAVKPNCSIQSYVAVLTALKKFEPRAVSVTSLQAISGAGKTFKSWPEMVDNVIPLIGGEEDKSEREPMKIWGTLSGGSIKLATRPDISATCIRVPVTDGHLASVSVSFTDKPTQKQILAAIKAYPNPLRELGLPSAPKAFITYMQQEDRPQTRLDRNKERGMGITMGRLRPGKPFDSVQGKHADWQFIALAHNTVRGAAGGALLMAELLAAKGYIKHS